MRAPSLLLILLLASGASAQTPPKPAAVESAPQARPKALEREATESVARAYESADSWSLRALVLLSLGQDFHPLGAGVVLKALRDKDARLQPYAVELLRRMDAEAVTQIAAPELVDELIERTSQAKHALLRSRTLEVLARMLPGVAARDRAAWRKWWSGAREAYVPLAWEPPPPPDPSEAGRTIAGSLVERAFDLRDAGLDVAIVIDSTGSMQVAIDAARDALDDVVTMLADIAPKLRLGLVEYRDLEDLGGGAQLLVPLTKGPDAVHDRLARLTAGGGGDLPERVDKGIELALGEDMRWNKEANRLILVIGDAPPHPESEDDLLRLVKRAYDEPFARGKTPATGAKARLRPFVTSTIATSPAAKPAFDAIAKAGGGASVQLDVPPPGERAAAAPGASAAARRVVEHIMLLSFGERHRAGLEVFVSTFFEYRDAQK